MEKQFEKASKLKLRVETNRGRLGVEQIWDMPLSSGDGFDLDTLALGLNDQLGETKKSFVSEKPEGDGVVKLAFDIVKHIIDVKLAERKARFDAANKKAKKQKLYRLLEKKEDEALGELTAEEIRKQIEDM